MTRTTSRPISVGVDGTGPSNAAVRWAAAKAGRSHRPLSLVHESWDMPYLDVQASGLQAAYAHTTAEGRRILADSVAIAIGIDPSLETHTALTTGDTLQALIEESTTAALMVVGYSSERPFHNVLGSTAYGLVRWSLCPVAVIRGQVAAVGDLVPVVVGTDGSTHADAAVGAAFEEAAERGTPLIAVHAWSDIGDDSFSTNAGSDVSWLTLDTEAHRAVIAQIAAWSEKYPDVLVERLLVHDQPREVLLGLSKQAQLVVVGSHGRGGFERMLLGSTSHALVERADCPVMVVRS